MLTPSYIHDVNFVEIIREELKACSVIPESARRNSRIDVDRSVAERAVAILTTYLARTRQVVTTTKHMSFPATWWDHLKQHPRMAWVARRWPVKMAEHPYIFEEVRRMYPHGDFDWKDGGHLAFLTWEPGSDIEIPTPETGTICQCGLALCYHRGDNPLAYRRNECMGYQPRYTQRELDRNDPSIYFKGDTDKPCCGNR